MSQAISIQTESIKQFNCILVKKDGTLKQLPPTAMNREAYIALTETSDSYKEAFQLHTTWKVAKYKLSIELWARTTGRAGQENKYEFPPPVDEVLFFGSCLLVMVNSPPQFSFTLDAWKKIYASLFGGFHDLSKTAAADETEYDEMKDIPKKHKTREGYLKDGFIVEEPATVSATSNKLKQLKGKPHKKNSTLNVDSNMYIPPAVSVSETQPDEVELEEEPYLDAD